MPHPDKEGKPKAHWVIGWDFITLHANHGYPFADSFPIQSVLDRTP